MFARDLSERKASYQVRRRRKVPRHAADSPLVRRSARDGRLSPSRPFKPVKHHPGQQIAQVRPNVKDRWCAVSGRQRVRWRRVRGMEAFAASLAGFQLDFPSRFSPRTRLQRALAALAVVSVGGSLSLLFDKLAFALPPQLSQHTIQLNKSQSSLGDS